MNPFDFIALFLSGLLVASVLFNLIDYQEELKAKGSLAQEVINLGLIINNLRSVSHESTVIINSSPGHLVVTNELISIFRDRSFSVSNPGVMPVDCFFNNSLIISSEVIYCA